MYPVLYLFFYPNANIILFLRLLLILINATFSTVYYLLYNIYFLLFCFISCSMLLVLLCLSSWWYLFRGFKPVLILLIFDWIGLKPISAVADVSTYFFSHWSLCFSILCLFHFFCFMVYNWCCLFRCFHPFDGVYFGGIIQCLFLSLSSVAPFSIATNCTSL